MSFISNEAILSESRTLLLIQIPQGALGKDTEHSMGNEGYLFKTVIEQGECFVLFGNKGIVIF